MFQDLNVAALGSNWGSLAAVFPGPYGPDHKEPSVGKEQEVQTGSMFVGPHGRPVVIDVGQDLTDPASGGPVGACFR